MRLLLAPALLLAAAPALAQDYDVERITLEPGQSATFTLAKGFDHQLLKQASPGDKGAITVTYSVDGGQSTVTAKSATGYMTVFTVLADPDGNGGFDMAGEVALPGDGKEVATNWPGLLGTINIGGFSGGPHGDHDHVPSGAND